MSLKKLVLTSAAAAATAITLAAAAQSAPEANKAPADVQTTPHPQLTTLLMVA